MRKQMLAPALSLLLIGFGTVIAGAQGHAQYAGQGYDGTTSLWITATAGKDHIRFASLGIAQRIRLEIVDQAGNRVLDSGFRDGNLLDWQVDDKDGDRLPDDVYGCLVTVEDMEGQFIHRRTLLRVTGGMARFESLQASNTAAAASPDGQDTVTIMPNDEELPMIQLLHDGESGRIVSGKGGLTFRTGNALAGEDVEHMRLTPEGDLGIGVSEPQARLDVAGIIRAEGIMFSDGTIQKTAWGAGVVPIGGIEQRLSRDGTPVVGRTTKAGTAAANRLAGARDQKRQRLTADKVADPIYAYEGATNTFYGSNAGAITTGDYNSYFGSAAGYANTTGTNNSFVGYQAGYSNTAGVGNSFIGALAGNHNGSGYDNTFLGYQSGFSNTDGSRNVFVGKNAGYSNSNGLYNSIFGNEAGFSNNGWANAFFGYQAGFSNTDGGGNVFIGSNAGYSNTHGGSNSFLGNAAGVQNTTGGANSFVGHMAGYENLTGSSNAFFGDASGRMNTTGTGNCFIGETAGNANTVGNLNTFLGTTAGLMVTTGSFNTLLGAWSDGENAITNATAVGYRAKVTQNNSLVLGSINGVNSATADTNVGIGTTAPTGRLHVKGGVNELLYVGTTGDIGIGTITPDKRVQVISTATKNATLHLGGAGDAAKDIFAGMGEDVDAGPAFNYGYAGYSFGRSAGFFNVRPDPSAVAPNPSLRFMTANQQRMIITNTGDVGIGTTDPKVTLQVQGSGVYVGSPGEGIILKSPDGLTCAKLTIDNSGTPGFAVIACP
ncbi:MAG: hypothetical protein H6Q05_4163 [Acidobacteria bacterium]|nr:hypothetical protein [Acidobacteriota bacterium]